MTEFGFDTLPEEQQAEMYQRIGEVLFKGVMIRALEEMSDEEQDAFDAFLSDHPEDPQALMNYLREKVDGFEALAADEVARFKASAVEIMNASQA